MTACIIISAALASAASTTTSSVTSVASEASAASAARAALLSAQGATGAEEFARRQYETGLAFLRDGRYQEALKDFQAVADNHPSSAVADQALLQIATYHLEQARDVARATTMVERLLKEYPTGRAAPFAYVLSGRIALAGGSGAAQVDAALASFERARRLFPVPEVVAAAGYFTAEALRAGGRCADALPAYQDVIVEYPGLAWAGRAELGAGRCLVSLDREREAMPHLQRVRRYARDMPAADVETALRWNTILARLFLRAPADPAFTFAGRAFGAAAKPIRDVVALAIGRDGQTAILTEQALVLYGPEGTIGESFIVREPRGLAMDANGEPLIVVDKGLLRPRTRELMALRLASSGGVAARLLEEPVAACVLSSGDIVVADRRTRAIHRFGADEQPRGALAALNVTRLAANAQDGLAAIERDSKAVLLLDAQGSVTRRVPARGDGYQLDDPVDVALDAIGHVYVLDRRQATVFVFGRDGTLVATLRSPATGDGAFSEPSSLTLDASGRVFVHDERQRAVVIYQ